jgi:hypothetical protein
MAENGPVVTAPQLAGARDRHRTSKVTPPSKEPVAAQLRAALLGDARFCPFDGDALVAAPGYRADADPLIGTVIGGRYEVQRVLGQGMGTVYGVRHRSLDKASRSRSCVPTWRAKAARRARFIKRRARPPPSVIRTSCRSPISASS